MKKKIYKKNNIWKMKKVMEGSDWILLLIVMFSLCIGLLFLIIGG